MPTLKSALMRLWRVLPIPNPIRWRILWAFNNKFLAGVVAIIFNPDGDVLLFHHTYRPDHNWAMPSGWLEPYEIPARAVQREVKEESDLDIDVVGPALVDTGRKRPRIDLYFHCELRGGTFRPSPEVAEMAWFSPDALPADMLPYQRVLIQEMSSRYTKGLPLQLDKLRPPQSSN